MQIEFSRSRANSNFNNTFITKDVGISLASSAGGILAELNGGREPLKHLANFAALATGAWKLFDFGSDESGDASGNEFIHLDNKHEIIGDQSLGGRNFEVLCSVGIADICLHNNGKYASACYCGNVIAFGSCARVICGIIKIGEGDCLIVVLGRVSTGGFSCHLRVEGWNEGSSVVS